MNFSFHRYNSKKKKANSDFKSLNDLKRVHKKILLNYKTKLLECISITQEVGDLKKIKILSNKLLKFKNIIFIGTGGSSLGGKTLVSLKKNIFLDSFDKKIFFVENIDPSPIKILLENLDLRKTAIVVTSKSGETMETLSQYFFISNYYKNKKINISKRLLIITENKKSTLKDIQENMNSEYFEHSKNIGGRFSIFSAVGLLPASISGLNISKIRRGGHEILEKMIACNNVRQLDFAMASLDNVNLIKKGYSQTVMMPYIDALDTFCFWFRQLWGESIGKKGLGSTPINSLGTVDQHSQLQLYLDGPKDKLITIIGYKKTNDSRFLNCKINKNLKYELLHKKTMGKLFDLEKRATFETLKKKKIPLRLIEIEKLNEKTLGSLIMHYFLETIYTCELLNINPFDQPAVENGKILARKYLNNE